MPMGLFHCKSFRATQLLWAVACGYQQLLTAEAAGRGLLGPARGGYLLATETRRCFNQCMMFYLMIPF